MKISLLMRFAAAGALCLYGAAAWSQTWDINLSNDAAMFRYVVRTTGSSGFGNNEADAGFLYTTDDDVVAMVGFQAVNETGTGSPGLTAGVGVKAFGATADKDNVLALTLGGQLHYNPPAFNRFGVLLQGFYAPDIVTFLDATRFTFLTLDLQYELLPQARVYAGYREVKTRLDPGGNTTIENGGHLGVEFDF